MKKVLFIDRDGTLILEPPIDFQVDSLEKLEFFPGVFSQLKKIVDQLDYDLVLVTNQDGLGTDSFPEETFWPAQNKMMKAFENEGVFFEDVLIDRTFESEGKPTRKPGTGMFGEYMNGDYDLSRSVVIGDRWSDVQLAANLGAKAIKIGSQDAQSSMSANLVTDSWEEIYRFLLSEERKSTIERTTSETKIKIDLNLNGSGISKIETGLKFFDHMLEQIAKHGLVDLDIQVDGDLEVDEHHTIEDTAIAMGEAFREALGNKLGIQRYGYCLPMDDCLAQVAIDFGGRNWIEWDAEFSRERVGDMPTEMFFHFFKSFTDGAQCNLNIKAEGKNEHHKIEAIFKALAKSIRMAVKQDLDRMVLPTTKGVL